jgi:hypothetical protein
LSLRKKKIKKKLTSAELANLQQQNQSQFLHELQGMSPEQADMVSNPEERVFFKKGDKKGVEIKGGENELVPLSDLDPAVGTETFIRYKDKSGRLTQSRTVITKDKRLLDESGQEIRKLY